MGKVSHSLLSRKMFLVVHVLHDASPIPNQSVVLVEKFSAMNWLKI